MTGIMEIFGGGRGTSIMDGRDDIRFVGNTFFD